MVADLLEVSVTADGVGKFIVLDLVPMQCFTHGNEGKHNKSSALTVFRFVMRSSHERLLMRRQIARR